jgi:fructose PTS system EIIBC or EIIC component
MKEKITFKALSTHMMTGVSYMIPVIAMGGILQSFGTMLGGAGVLQQPGTIAYMLFTAGQAAMNLVVPILAAFIAYSICDRPGIAPGLLVGVLAVNMKIGFIGGIIGGYLVGYFCAYIKNNIKVYSAVKPLMPLLIIPLAGGLFAILLMNVLIGPPLAGFQEAMVNLFKTMGVGSRFLFGSILGGLVGIDMAGPIGKIGTTVANGLMADGIFGPEGAKVCCCMVPPLALGISSVFLNKRKYTQQEAVAGKSAILLGLFQVTEGGLPFLLNDPLRVIPCTVIGAGISGGLAMVFGVESPVTMGGIAAFPVMTGVFPGAFIAVGVGVIVAVGLLALIKKDVKDDEEEKNKQCAEDLDIHIEL